MEEARARNYIWVFYWSGVGDIQHICASLCAGKYYVFGCEKCPTTGRDHLQGYLEWTDKISMNALKKYFPNDTVHFEIARGTRLDNYKYCRKLDTMAPNVFWYVKPGCENMHNEGQGTRTDLKEVYERIEQGVKVDDLAIENPMMYHQYGRTLTKLEDIVMRKKYRHGWFTECIWLWGKTGVGKSHRAFDGYTPDKCYNWPNDGEWWDAYQQQELVIINDFRGEIRYADLLKMIDCWPYDVRRRGREPMPFLSKRVIITSSGPPEKIYAGVNERDSLEQLKRRIVVEEVKTDTDVLP